MGLTDRVRRWALARPPVLIITAPGNDRLRWLVEAQADRRGWPLAHAPADADLLLTVGPLGAQLSAAVDILWSQIPGPRHRAAVTREAIVAQLDAAAMALVAAEAYESDSDDAAALLSTSHHAGHEGHPMGEHGESGSSHHTDAGHQMGHEDAPGEDSHGEGAHGEGHMARVPTVVTRWIMRMRMARVPTVVTRWTTWNTAGASRACRWPGPHRTAMDWNSTN